MYPLLLLVLLIALAGFIAYAGDQLGTLVGRRRLSVFGWRPKRTGQAVGVVAGVLIMLSTMGVLSLAFRDATAVLLRSQQIARELTVLRDQRGELEAQVARTQAELNQARATAAEAEAARDLARAARDAAFRTRTRILAEQDTLRAELTRLEARTASLADEQLQLEAANRALQDTNAELSLANESLGERNEQLSQQNAAFEDLFNNLQNQVVTLQTELQELRLTSEREAQNLRDTLSQFEAASGSELAYRRGEIVYFERVAAQDEEAIFEALQQFVAGAQREVFGRGGSGVELRTDQLGGLAGAIAATPGEDLVALVAADNFVRSAQVVVEVEARENSELLPQGQLIASRQVHVGSPSAPVSRAALRAEVARLAQESFNRLQRIGLFEQVRLVPSEADFSAFTASLSRLSGAVVIGAVARESVYVAGPVELEFVILY